MIHSVRLMEGSKGAFFTFKHPRTPKRILGDIYEHFREITLRKRYTEESNTQEINIREFSIQFCTFKIKRKKIVAAVLYDQKDNPKRISKILDTFFSPHIRARIAREIQKGGLKEKTKIILTDELLDAVNKRVDPVSRRGKESSLKYLLPPAVCISLWPLFHVTLSFLPLFLESLNEYHYILTITLTVGIGVFLSLKRAKNLKKSSLYVIISLIGYVLSLLLTNTFSFQSLPDLYLLLLCGSIAFTTLTTTQIMIQSRYLSPPQEP